MMQLTIDFWQLLAIGGAMVAAFITVVWQVSQITVRQYDRMLAERFSVVSAQLERETGSLRALEKEVMALKMELPEKYVLRTDFLRQFTTIEGKLDGLAKLIQDTILKGNNHAT